MNELGLTPQEERVMEATFEVMRAIKDLYNGAPANYEGEVIPAIHVLQQFARQHWAHRINPEYWSNWEITEVKTPGAYVKFNHKEL